jgi:hypothetical protein
VLALFLTIRQFVRAAITAWRDPEFRSLAVIGAGLLAIATAFYRHIEGWSWLDRRSPAAIR